MQGVTATGNYRGRYFQIRLVHQARDDVGDEERWREGCVSLEIDDNFGTVAKGLYSRCTSLGPIGAVTRGHDDSTAEANDLVSNAFVVRRNKRLAVPRNSPGSTPTPFDQSSFYAASA